MPVSRSLTSSLPGCPLRASHTNLLSCPPLSLISSNRITYFKCTEFFYASGGFCLLSLFQNLERWPWKCTSQTSHRRIHNWPGPQLVCSEIHHRVCTKAVFSTGCLQLLKEAGRKLGRSFSRRHRTFWQPSLTWRLPDSLAETSLDWTQPSFPLFFSPGQTCTESDDFSQPSQAPSPSPHTDIFSNQMFSSILLSASHRIQTNIPNWSVPKTHFKGNNRKKSNLSHKKWDKNNKN